MNEVAIVESRSCKTAQSIAEAYKQGFQEGLKAAKISLMLTGSRNKSITDTIITFARSADAARSIRKVITVRIAEGE